MELYTQWHRKFSIRLPGQLLNPPQFNLEETFFPYGTVLHYLNRNELVDDTQGHEDAPVGPLVSDPLFSLNTRGSILVDVNQRYRHMDVLGKPVVQKSSMGSILNEYYHTDPRIRRYTKGDSMVSNRETLLVATYTLFEEIYRYPQHVRSGWFAWYNAYASMCYNIRAIAEEHPDKHQFILYSPPVVLPSLSELNKVRETAIALKSGERLLGKLSDSRIKLFGTDDVRYFIDLWMFLSDAREKSILHMQLKNVNPDKINFCFIIGHKVTFVNMAKLLSFIRFGEDGTGQYSAVQMRKNVLVFFMRLNQSISTAGDLQAPEDDPERTALDRALELDDPTRILDIDAGRLPGKRVDVEVIDTTAKNKRPILSELAASVKLKAVFDEIDKGQEQDVASVDLSDVEIPDGLDEEELQALIVDRDIDQLEAQFARTAIESEYAKVYRAYEPPSDKLEDAIFANVDDLTSRGRLTSKEAARLKSLAVNYKEMDSPYGDGKTVEKAMEITPDDVKLEPEVYVAPPELKGVRDKKMLICNMFELDQSYVKKLYRKDTMQAVMHVQRAGYAVEDWKVDKVDTAMDRYELHKVNIVSPNGTAKLVQFKLPHFNKDNHMLIGGVKLRFRTQVGEIPIRKIGSSKVALTSYISKIFIKRTDRSAFNYDKWLHRSFRDQMAIPESGISDVILGKCHVYLKVVPRKYSAMAKLLSSFKLDGMLYNFDYAAIKASFDDDALKTAAKFKIIPLAKGEDGVYFINADDEVLKQDSESSAMVMVGSFESVLKLNGNKAPVDYATFPLLGDDVPLGVILAYHVGLGNLLATLQSKFRRVPRGERAQLKESEFLVKFQDESLVFNRSDRVTAILMGGFNRYHAFIGKTSVYQYDNKDVYGALLDNYGISAKKLVEVDTAMALWVDHITKGELTDMGHPTDLFNLLIVAAKMLTYDHHSDKNERLEERDRGIERMSGKVYNELYRAIRKHKSSAMASRTNLDLNPSAIWMSIILDSAEMQVEESNPVHNMKEQEELTLGGDGGRSSLTLMAEDRKYHPNAIGSISEATVDSSEVGAKIFRCANPKYANLRGRVTALDKVDGNESHVFSSSALLSPGSNIDSIQRLGFTSIQFSSTMHADGYTPVPYRTGYERVVPHRVGDLFCTSAKKNGLVESIKHNVITVKYEDDTYDRIKIGLRHGNWSGKVIPHKVKTDLKAGDKVELGSIIAYNTGFFKKDTLYPGQVIFSTHVLARTVMWEEDVTYEDSCELSENLCSKLGTTLTKAIQVLVPADSEIKSLIKLGDKTMPDTPLCVIYPPLSMGGDDRDEVSMEILSKLSNDVPKAKYSGTVESIELYYSAEVDDMTASLRDLVEEYDAKKFKECKQLGINPYSNSVSNMAKIQGKDIGTDNVMLVIHIGYQLTQSGGDKVVFANQMKSVPAGVIKGDLISKDGKLIDAKFGLTSAENRKVRSIYLQGTTNTLLVAIGQLACSEYYGT